MPNNKNKISERKKSTQTNDVEPGKILQIEKFGKWFQTLVSGIIRILGHQFTKKNRLFEKNSGLQRDMRGHKNKIKQNGREWWRKRERDRERERWRERETERERQTEM